jgi:hypothetical protein
MLTHEQFMDGLTVLVKFVVRLLALVGLFSLIALSSYLYHKDEVVKVSRSDRCINSACEPGQKCSVRFKRHTGNCE